MPQRSVMHVWPVVVRRILSVLCSKALAKLGGEALAIRKLLQNLTLNLTGVNNVAYNIHSLMSISVA